MKRLTLELELDYDDCGNVIAWKVERKNVELVTIEISTLDDPVVLNPEQVVGERLVDALNFMCKAT